MPSTVKTADAKSPRARTSESLRNTLFDEIDSLRNGKSDNARAGAVAKLANAIISSARADIEFSKYHQPDGSPLHMKKLLLGTMPEADK